MGASLSQRPSSGATWTIFYRSLLSVRKSARLIGAAWFSFQDERVAPGHRDYWGFHNGLFRRDGSAKPAWRTLKLRALNGY